MTIDYSAGKIYRIICNASGKQYIGSTTQSLSKRLNKHKQVYKEWINGYIPPAEKKSRYMRSFDILKNDDYVIVLIEDYPCNSKNELERRERYFIDTLDCVNKNRPALTEEERKHHQRQYYEQNKDKFAERKKKYYEENKETLIQYSLEYREKNKDKINQKFNCECGGHYSSSNKQRHFRTLQHQNFVMNK